VPVVRAVRIVVVLPETWREIVTSIIRTDERLLIVATYDSHPDPLAAAREADADFLITMEADRGALEHAGTRPAIVLVEEGGRSGRVLRFRPQSEPLHALSGATLVSSLAAMSTR
jgi:hypothetical protein